MQRQPVDRSALIHRMLLGELDLPMRVLPPSSFAAGGSGIALLVVKDHKSTTFTVLYLIATALMASLGITTATISHPINIAISKWPTETLLSAEGAPPGYPRMRRRWDRIMTFRVAAGTGAFVCYLLASIGWR
jgi:Domain of unknown function (DUF1772)